MKVLLLNGSPRVEHSATLRIAHAFVEGMKQAQPDLEVVEVPVYKKNVGPCRGCYACWKNKAHQCVQKDDMQAIVDDYLTSDVVLWCFPLYFYSLPCEIKKVMERLLVLADGHINVRPDGSMAHSLHYELNQRHVVISSCGFGNLEHNYEAVTALYENYVKVFSRIYCSEGSILLMDLEPVRDYFARVTEAGAAYVRTGAIPQELKLEEPIVPVEEYLAAANEYLDDVR